MDIKQTLVLVGILIGFILSMVLAWFYTQSSQQQSALDSTKRFTAKPGTTRDNALILTTDKREESESIATSDESVETADGLRVRSLSRKEEDVLSESDEAIREAMNSLSPEQGLEKLQAMLAENPPPEEASHIETAMGRLYSQTDPPDYESAEKAFARAKELAGTVEARQAITIFEAQMLYNRGSLDAARSLITESLKTGGEATFEELQLRVMLGQVEEMTGESGKAEVVYTDTLEKAMAIASDEDEASDDLTDLIRLTALRISHLYRKANRQSDLTELERQLGAFFESHD